MQAFFKYLGIPTTPLLVPLVQFWDDSITYTFVIFLLRMVSNLQFGHIFLYNPYCKFNLKFRPWRSWAIMLNFFVADQCSQRHNKNHHLTCLDDFNKNWHTLTWHVTQDMWHVTCETMLGVNILSTFQLPNSYDFGETVFSRCFHNGSVT